jgi:hypothetical protein
VSARACLPDPDDEDVMIDQVRRRRIALTTMREPTNRLAIEELARAIQASRR